jgi:hypothetical protein
MPPGGRFLATPERISQMGYAPGLRHCVAGVRRDALEKVPCRAAPKCNPHVVAQSGMALLLQQVMLLRAALRGTAVAVTGRGAMKRLLLQVR